MSNTAYLYNLDAPAVVINGAVQGRQRAIKGLVVAEAADRVPLTWLMAFAPTDLQLTQARYRTGPTTWHARPVLAPVASVGAALDGFLHRRDELARLVGDARIVEGFVRITCDALSALPLAYLALDPLEVVDLNDPDEPSRALQRALGQGPGSTQARLALAGFARGVLPYPVEALYARAPDKLTQTGRQQNAAALDPAFLPRDQWKMIDIAPPPARRG